MGKEVNFRNNQNNSFYRKRRVVFREKSKTTPEKPAQMTLLNVE